MLLPVLLVTTAVAGDQPLYERALYDIETHYLHDERIDHAAMFSEAGRQLEARIEWLLVEDAGGRLRLRDGAGTWTAEVAGPGAELPVALSNLEDAVRAAGLPIDADVDLRVEILRGVVKTLDRHSVVLHADGLERFDERLSGTLSGVGATISSVGGRLRITELVPAGPAQRAGVKVDDLILRIDGVSTVGMVPADATTRIRGVAGSTVTLLVDRGGQTLEVPIRREEIAIRNVTAARGPRDVGVLTIEHFSEQTRAWLSDGLDDLGQMGVLANGLVIDVRGNTGGSLIQSAQAADLFLQTGLIVSTVGRDGGPVPSLIPRWEAHLDTPPYAMPLVVLMDHATASGSEILAGSLARLDRALLVGATSFGKGTVQKIYQLDSNIKLKLTVAEYRLDGDWSVADVGLAPDIALEPVRLEPEAIWWPSPARRKNLPPGTPVIRYAEVPTREAELEIAAALAVAASGGTRAALLDAASEKLDALARDEDLRLVAAMRERGLDWSAPPLGATSAAPNLEIQLGFVEAPTPGGVARVQAKVVNRGGELWRAAVRLESVNPLWDDLVLPLGHVPTGATVVGVGGVDLPAGEAARTDRVLAFVEAEGLPLTAVGSRDLSIDALLPPSLAVSLRARPAGDGVLRVTLDVDNRGDRALGGVVARFDFPDLDGVELVDRETAPAAIGAQRSNRLTLDLKVDAAAYTAATLPLDLVLEGELYGRLARWQIELPRDGSALRLEPPQVSVDAPPLVLPPGTATITLRAADDKALDHVVVFAGPETMNRARAEPSVEHKRDKVAWRPARGRRLELQVKVPVAPGANHYVVVAEDRLGLRTVRDVYVLGDDGTAVAAPE